MKLQLIISQLTLFKLIAAPQSPLKAFENMMSFKIIFEFEILNIPDASDPLIMCPLPEIVMDLVISIPSESPESCL